MRLEIKHRIDVPYLRSPTIHSQSWDNGNFRPFLESSAETTAEGAWYALQEAARWTPGTSGTVYTIENAGLHFQIF